MITKEFNTKKERIEWLIENKNSLIAQKKATLKTADAFGYVVPIYDAKEDVYKANNPITNFEELDSIKVKAVINTTNVIDSHMDLHLKGIWNKSVKENKMIMHLAEHKMTFDDIISDGANLKAYVQNTTWRDLGYNLDGETQALTFDSVVRADRNEKMFKQYAKGNVRNHSVGMQYVKMFLAVNDERYEEEFKVWEKYINLAVNKEVAEEYGYFWAVTEAKVIEGSAVPIGSNTYTPTQDNNYEPNKSFTQQQTEPSDMDTQLSQSLINLSRKIESKCQK